MQPAFDEQLTKSVSPELSRDSLLPLHKQVEQWLRKQIVTGAFPPGTRLPNRKQFSELLGGINHLTINKAVMALTREGLVYSMVGRGTFVAEPMKKQIRIALILPSIDDAHTRAIAKGVQDFCGLKPDAGEQLDLSRQKTGVVLFDSQRDLTQEIENIRHLEDLPLDGAIVWPLAFGNMVEHLVRLKGDRFPLVLLDEIPGMMFHTVNNDDYDGGYQMTKHIVSTGRKRIAWVSNRKAIFSGGARYEGYRDAMVDSGLLADRKLTCDLDMASPTASFQEPLERVIKQLFEANPPDAIICGNDQEAMATIKILRRRGITVPGDVSVAGFGGAEVDDDFSPRLTTGVISSEKMGRAAANLLLQVIADPDCPPERLKIPIPLLVRESA